MSRLSTNAASASLTAADFPPAIRALAYPGDADYVVERASDPPTTADARFREEALPIAARVAEQLRVAQDLLAGAALDLGARAAIGRGLQDVVGELRGLAESYAIDPVSAVLRARESGAALLDARAVAGIEHVAHALLDAGDSGGSAAAREPEAGAERAAEADEREHGPSETSDEAPAPFRPPTGPALVELLAHGISGIERWPGTPLDMPAVPAPVSAPGPDGEVSIDTLLYRGRAALDRARELGDTLRAGADPPDPELLAELYDLLDLAATE